MARSVLNTNGNHASQARPILRLTRVPRGTSSLELRAEGRVVGEWTVLLEQECAAATQEFQAVDLDLGAVTYVDTMGVAALRRLVRSQITISNCPPLIEELLGEGERP